MRFVCAIILSVICSATGLQAQWLNLPAILDKELALGQYGYDGKRVYILGGYYPTDATLCDTVFMLDSDHPDRWRAWAQLPRPLMSGYAAARPKRFYIVGGATEILPGQSPEPDGYIFNRATYEYNLTENSFRELAPIPRPVMVTAAAADGDRIYLLGGNAMQEEDTTALQPTRSIQVYNMASDSWMQMGETPFHSEYGRAVLIDSIIYYMGNPETDEPYGYRGKVGIDAISWEPIADPPVRLVAPAIGRLLSDVVLTAGGIPQSSGTPEASFEMYFYDPAMDTWRTGPPVALSPRMVPIMPGDDYRNIYLISGEGSNRTFRYFAPLGGTSTDEKPNEPEIAISPTPASEQLTVTLPPNGSAPNSVRIITISGSETEPRITAFEPGRLQLDLGTLPSGIYLLRIDLGTTSVTRRFTLVR